MDVFEKIRKESELEYNNLMVKAIKECYKRGVMVSQIRCLVRGNNNEGWYTATFEASNLEGKYLIDVKFLMENIPFNKNIYKVTKFEKAE